jgi:hypothetical protein
MHHSIWKGTALAAALSLTVALSACSDTYSRDDFTTAAIGKSEQEITAKFGKPSEVDESNPEHVVWVYKHETFNLQDQNKIDSKTMVIFEGAAGSRHVAKVDFG